MNTFADRINSIKDQVTRLIRDQHALKERASDLEKEAHDHQRMTEVLKARVAELERENEGLRKAKPQVGESGTGTNERIDELVLEIDRCLALLGTETGGK
ncbi:MAG: hypothetical protein IPH21_12585 [Flavobacteriales bacterium]|nr:hypothetical protein [Flavobacteriales bacterium]